MNLARQRQRHQEIAAPVTKADHVNKELQGYDAVHAHAQFDLDNYLQGRRDSLERREREMAEDVEIPVEEERERSRANITRMQEIAASHEAGYKQMLMKIKEEDLEHAALVVAEAAAKKKHGIPFPIEDVQTGSGRANRERLHNACMVANELVQRRFRHDRFQRRRRSCMNEEAKKLDILERKHEEADKRVALRQREIAEKLEEKTCLSQQRHGEQQKMFKEIQKFQEKQFEKLQLKHHPEAVSTCKNVNHDHMVSSSAPPSRPSSIAPPDLEEEPRSPKGGSLHRMQAHKLYNKTLDQWGVFVTHNERRMDAYWLKMLDGQPRQRRMCSRLGAFKKGGQKVCTLNTFIGKAKTHTSKNTLGVSANPHEEEVEVEPIAIASRSILSPAKYQERLARAQSYQADLQQRALEKRERDTLAFEKKQQKSKEELRLKADRAKSHNSNWEEKSALSSTKRESLALRSDSEILEKLAQQKHEREEKERKQNVELETMRNLKTIHSLNVKANAKMQHESLKESLKEKQDAKQHRLVEKLASSIQEAEDITANQDHVDNTKRWMSIKSASEQSFSLNTAKSIEMKRQRSEKMKLEVLKPRSPMEAIERQRALHKNKVRAGSRTPPPELTLTAEPELTLTPGWDAVHESLELVDMMGSMDNYASCGSARTQESASSVNIKNMKLSALSTPAGSKCPSSRSHRSSAPSLSSGDGDSDDSVGEFLTQLQGRSSKWLGDMKRKEKI